MPNGKTMTLELNGYWLSRNLGDSDSKGDGEVLNVGYGSTLNVYGGNKEDPAYRSNAEHNMWVYTAREYDKPARKQVKLYGGIINGGNSTDGAGGIHMHTSSRLNLYHVTVAGNQADNRAASYGDGGGIYNDATKNAVDSCSICLNVAMNPKNAGGGGLFLGQL